MKKYYLLFVLFAIQIQVFASRDRCEPGNQLSSAVMVTPTFNPIGFVCQNSVAPALPSVSLNGISGTWNPLVNTAILGTNIYTFTPNPGQDADTVSIPITVVAQSSLVLDEDSSMNQSVSIGFPIQPILFEANNYSLFSVSGLAPGLEWSFIDGILSIHGTPEVLGTFVYEITPTDGCAGMLPFTGIITCSPPVPDLQLASPLPTANQIVCVGNWIAPIVYTANNASAISVVGLPSGVTGIYAAGTMTISGTPISTGVFNYTVTATGVSGASSAIGVIVSNPDVTLSLASTPATAVQTVCLTTPIVNIVYTVGNGATGAFVMGLPSGLTSTFNAATQTMTISGTTLAIGTYNYYITTTGGCSSATLMGTITVVPNATITLISSVGTNMQTVCDGMPIIPISYAFMNGATSATILGLPPGVTSTISQLTGTVTITGTPTAPGTYNYSVTTIGGCGSAVIVGTIIVNDEADLGIFCESTLPNSIGFDWTPALGATGYNYSYTIESNPAVTGTTMPSHFTVMDVLPGQSVTFTITSVGGSVPCFIPQTITCTSLANTQFNSEAFAYYPVPVTDVLHLEYDQPLIDITIYNTLGQQVLCHKIEANKTAIDLSGLQSEVYIAKVTTATSSKTIRLIKQ